VQNENVLAPRAPEPAEYRELKLKIEELASKIVKLEERAAGETELERLALRVAELELASRMAKRDALPARVITLEDLADRVDKLEKKVPRAVRNFYRDVTGYNQGDSEAVDTLRPYECGPDGWPKDCDLPTDEQRREFGEKARPLTMRPSK
jgi:hypothetical protein